MKQFVTLSVLLVVAAIARAEDKPKFDASKLVGDWTYVSGEKGGAKIDKKNLEGKVVVTKDTFTVPSGDPAKPFVMKYTINDKVSPPTIDMTITAGPVKDAKAVGIITIEGEEVKLCYVDGTEKRPTKFESTKDNKAFYFVLKKAK